MTAPGMRSHRPSALQYRRAVSRRDLIFGLPVLGFGTLAGALGWGLTRNPQELPSALLGRPVPEFRLPPVKGRTLGLSNTDLVGEVSLVNVFASWCIPCRAGHTLLLRIAAEGNVSVHGLNYRDAPDEAARSFDGFGDPYIQAGADID